MGLKPCPFCGYKIASLRCHQAKFLGENDMGAKKIKFTGYIACNKCLSRSKPVSVVMDNVHCYGWGGGRFAEQVAAVSRCGMEQEGNRWRMT